MLPGEEGAEPSSVHRLPTHRLSNILGLKFAYQRYPAINQHTNSKQTSCHSVPVSVNRHTLASSSLQKALMDSHSQGRMGDFPFVVQVAPKTGGYTLGSDNACSSGLHMSREDALPRPHFPDVNVVQTHIREALRDRLSQLSALLKP